MVTVDSAAERRDGVTLVTATVAGADVPVRVTLASRLDGPLWPPRRQGEPAAGWTDDGFEAVVPADGRLALGFASPAAPVDPPLELVATEPAAAPSDGMDSPAAVVRGLGDPTPPSLIEPDSTGVEGADERTVGTEQTPADADPLDRSTELSPGQPDSAREGPTSDDRPATPIDAADSLPPAVAEWLDAVESRVDHAEALSPDASVDAATQALCTCGGVEGARDVDDQLSADVERLQTVERRVASLAERAEAASVATDALDRLA